MWRCCNVSLSTDAAKSAARACSAPQRQVRRHYLMKLKKIKCRWKTRHLHICTLLLFSSHRGDKATSVLHDVLGQCQRRDGEPQSGLPNLLLHQGQAVVQTSAGQQHQCSGCHLLRRTMDCRGKKFSDSHSCSEPVLQTWNPDSWANASVVTFRCDWQ